jgi:L-ascorbate metabolism protein UlaG (beta-lactamase superfamily)
MKITWYGHAAFAIEGRADDGRRRKVILDPYNFPACGGYLPINDCADVVSISHENPRYHSDTSAIRGPFELLRALEVAPGVRCAGGVCFEAFRVFENDRGEGPNAMVKLRLDGLTVAHQGDLGHALEGEALEFLRGVDVLFALAGGPPTIGLEDQIALLREVRPSWVFPMHYKTLRVNLKIQPVEDFLALCGDFEVQRPGIAACEISAAERPPRTRVVVLEHAR